MSSGVGRTELASVDLLLCMGLFCIFLGRKFAPSRAGLQASDFEPSIAASRPHPDLRLLVFCVRLPCAACSRMLCFSSSRWPLVVSTGTGGSLPGPLGLLFSSGTGVMRFAVFVIQCLRDHTGRTTAARAS